MSPELVLYYDHKSIQSISELYGVSRKTMTSRMVVERKRLGLHTRGRGAHYVSDDVMEFLADKKLIIKLSKDGMSFSDIADKWDISERTVSKYLSRWGMIVEDTAKEKISFVSLSELYTGWADIHQGEEIILTVNKKPMFKLVRIL